MPIGFGPRPGQRKPPLTTGQNTVRMKRMDGNIRFKGVLLNFRNLSWRNSLPEAFIRFSDILTPNQHRDEGSPRKIGKKHNEKTLHVKIDPALFEIRVF